MSDWRAYQRDTAQFFRDIGLDAETDVTLDGARTRHDIDVVIRSQHVGFDLLWIVECKLWRTRVTKLHVLALRTIVHDIGADRGLVMAEAGFQSGAVEASALTNVHVTSLEALRSSASYDLGMARLRSLQERVDVCRRRYWDLPKDIRIRHGLRPEVLFDGYSGRLVLEITQEALNCAFRGIFPVRYESGAAFSAPDAAVPAATPTELYMHFEPHVADLENKLDQAYAAEGITEST